MRTRARSLPAERDRRAGAAGAERRQRPLQEAAPVDGAHFDASPAGIFGKVVKFWVSSVAGTWSSAVSVPASVPSISCS